MELTSRELVQRIVLLEEYILTLENVNKIKSKELDLKELAIRQLTEEISRLRLSKPSGK